MKHTKFTLICFLLVLPIYAYAEGGGHRKPFDVGINRRVNSKLSGYVGVYGQFSASVETPPRILEDGEDLDDEPDIDLNPNRYATKPTYYLGSHISSSSDTKEVDAGLQYYNWSYDYPSGNHLDPGWGAFISRGPERFVTPKIGVLDPVRLEVYWEGYRESETNSTTYSLRYEIATSGVDKGKAYLTATGGELSGIDKFPWTEIKLDTVTPTEDRHFPQNSDGTSFYSSSDISVTAVKRIIGITQGSTDTYELDGSIMIGTYSKGQVLKNGETKWKDWTLDIVDPSETNYDVDEDEKDAQWGTTDTVASQYILTFPKIEPYTYTNKQGTFTIPAESTDPNEKTTRKKALPTTGQLPC